MSSFLGAIATTQNPTTPRKVITIGPDGCDFSGTDERAFQRAHDSLGDNGGLIYVREGTYTFKAPVNVTKQNVWFAGSWGALIVAANGGSTALFNVTNTGFGLEGLWLYADQVVNDQALVRLSGSASRSQFNKLRVEFNLLAADANPMIGFYFDTVATKTLHQCLFLPGRGTTGIYAQLGRDLRVNNCEFTNGQDGEAVYTPRLAWRCVHIRHDGWAKLNGNEFWGLALPDPFGGPPGDAVVLYEHVTGVANKPEAGHLMMVGNRIEGCSFNYFVRAQGLRWGHFASNFFGTSNRQIAGITEAALSFLSENGIGGGQVCDQIMVTANQFHNTSEVASSGGVGNSLYAANTNDISVIANQFANCQMPYVCEFNTPTTQGLVVADNSFAPGIVVPTACIRLAAAAGTAKYVIGPNYSRGIATAISKAGGVTGNFLERGVTKAQAAECDGATTFAAGAAQIENWQRLT